MVLIDGFVIWVFSGQYLKYQNQFFVFHKHGTHKVRFRQHPPLWVFDDTNPTIRNESLRSKPCQIHIKPIETIIVGNVWLEENGMQNSALLARFLAWSFESNVSHAREACLAPPLKNEKSLASNFVRPRSVKISWNHWGISVGIHTGPTSTSTEIGEKVCGWSISINPNTLLQIQREAACDWNILKYIAQIFEGQNVFSMNQGKATFASAMPLLIVKHINSSLMCPGQSKFELLKLHRIVGKIVAMLALLHLIRQGVSHGNH